ncbi:hypothetical protein RGUI_3062 [Rhodovulum sp. P5]|uniref:hypothetical protein n=1 Tax=Rhodovulum sp. P5 TaxID=1564506 RepID=UPI0009C3195B|nr:hypothetical protein [Rhodovulum sp. P5]ARE41203.1 hypothetical protein RGUI_3062 [Rhodovulum sp. P5]
MRILAGLLAGIGLSLAAAGTASADWKTLVIGQPGPAAETSFADAFYAAQAFEAGGLPVLDVLRDQPAIEVLNALSGLRDTPQLILFYSGRVQADALALQDGAVPLDDILTRIAAAGVREVILMVEDCVTGQPGPPQPVRLPGAQAGLQIMLVTSAAGGTCSPGTRLSDVLKTLGQSGPLTGDLLVELGGLPMQGRVTGQVVMTGAAPAATDAAEEVVEYLPDDVILLDAPAPAAGADTPAPVVEVLLPAQTPDFPARRTDLAEPVITLAALPAAQVAALPLVPGLPEPSIIVGLIEGITDAALDTDAPEDGAPGMALAYNDLNARRALKTNNPQLFDTLLSSGALDPPEGLLEVALQTELQRMNCYTMRVDGDWGPGSRRSAQNYFRQLDNVPAPADAATMELFRLMLRYDDVTCPTPQAVAPRTNTNPRQATPARPAAPAPQPAQPATGGGGGFGGGNFGGVFR